MDKDLQKALGDTVDELYEDQSSVEAKVTVEFVKQYLQIELDIKELKDQIKIFKDEAKANGVNVPYTIKMINALKKEYKTSAEEVQETETIKGILENDVDVKSLILRLTEK